MTTYALPDLPYDYAALEPYISGEIMELHHDKHHATYVKGINSTVDQLSEMRDKEEFTFLGTLEKNLAFHLGGHVNHSVFWANMSPDGGDKPIGDLAARIDADFGSFDKFRAQFEATALGVQGSGWAVLGYDHIGQRLVIEEMTDQQGNLSIDLTPILMLDMWEHAFYLQYKNVKADYVKAVWNVFNWEDAAERYAKATAK